MGLQQILLIVLGVVVVGVAISVGVVMFQNQGYVANRQALAVELTQYGTNVITFWKTPLSQGGAGNNPDNLTMNALGPYIGFTQEASKMVAVQNWGITSENGQIRLASIDTDTYEVTLKALGNVTKGNKHPYVELLVDVLTGSISSTMSDAESF